MLILFYFSIASFDVSRSSDNILNLSPQQEMAKTKSKILGLRGVLHGHTRSHSEGAIAKFSIKSRKWGSIIVYR